MLLGVSSCRTAKVHDGERLLVKNQYKYEGKKIFARTTLNEFVRQKPNSTFLGIPISLYMYNVVKDSLVPVFTEYYDYPKNDRNQELLNNLYIKHDVPQYINKKKSLQKFFYRNGKPPVIVKEKYTKGTTKTLQNYFINKGYRIAEVSYEIKQSKQLFNNEKKAVVVYKINPGEPTEIASYNKQIEDPAVKEIIDEYEKNSRIKVGDKVDEYKLKNEIAYYEQALRNNGYYKFNQLKDRMFFEADSFGNPYEYDIALRIVNDSTGNYRKSYIQGITTTLTNRNMTLTNEECKNELPDGTKLCNRLYNERGLRFIKDTLTSLRKEMGKTQFALKSDSLLNKVIYPYLDREGDNRKFTAFKNEVMTFPQVIKMGELYRYKDISNTKNNYFILDNFDLRKNVVNNSNLDSLKYYFELVPKKKHSIKLLGEVSYSDFLKVGTTVGVQDFRRNVFRGAENLSTTFSVTLGTVSNDEGEEGRFFNAYDFSLQSSLKYPRWVLFKRLSENKLKQYSPTSALNVGASIQNNIGLGRYNFNSQINYYLQPNDLTTHKLTLFNTQYTRYLDPEKYYDIRPNDKGYVINMLDNYLSVYDPAAYQLYLNDQVTLFDIVDNIYQSEDDGFLNYLEAQNPELYNQMRYVYRNKEINTQNILINSMVYTVRYNQNRNALKDNPFTFYGKFELSGTLMSLLDKAFGEDTSEFNHTIFNVPYSQFVKMEFDLRKQYSIANRNRLVGRFFFGIGLPFGNSENLPYDRNYISGGANDMRAWQPFSLGPGDSKDEFSLGGFDNLKLITSLEWRFPLTNELNGALFTDIGNVWGTNKDYDYIFKFDSFYNQVGIGSGVGVRYDLGFLTLRVDWGLKIYNPKYDLGSRWNFHRIFVDWDSVKNQTHINFGIGYPF